MRRDVAGSGLRGLREIVDNHKRRFGREFLVECRANEWKMWMNARIGGECRVI
jgi:hypothetical protein